jgi:hypothetical protein
MEMSLNWRAMERKEIEMEMEVKKDVEKLREKAVMQEFRFVLFSLFELKVLISAPETAQPFLGPKVVHVSATTGRKIGCHSPRGYSWTIMSYKFHVVS